MAISPAERDEFSRSILEIIIPDGHAKLDCLHHDDLGSLRNAQRSRLYYDELLPVLITFHSQLSESTFRSCLENARLSVSAHLQAHSPQQEAAPPGQKQDPSIKVVLGSFSANAAAPNYVQAIKSNESVAMFVGEVHLHHPERQVFRPNIFLTASLHCIVPDVVIPDPIDDYLPSGIPLSGNLLSPLLSIPALAGSGLNLPVSRLEKVVPISSMPQVETRSIRQATILLPIGPALLLRTSRTLFADQVYLSLDTHVPIHAKSPVKLQAAEARLPLSIVTALTTVPLPVVLQPGDRTTFIFQTGPQFGTSAAQYHLSASFETPNGSSVNLSIRRNLNAPQEAELPSRERIKHWSVPKGTSRPSSTIAAANEMPGMPKKGLKITIKAPHTVEMGTTFSIRLLILNNSARKRRLSILGPAAPSSSKGANRSSWVVRRTGKSSKDHAASENIATAVTDQQELHDQVTGSRFTDKRRIILPGGKHGGPRAELVTLDPEVKLGVLQPGACHEAYIKVQALSVGVVSIEGMVVADLDSRETCLIGEGWEGICYDTEDAPVIKPASGIAVTPGTGVAEEVLIADAAEETHAKSSAYAGDL